MDLVYAKFVHVIQFIQIHEEHTSRDFVLEFEIVTQSC